ncbi:hypothetical protein CDG81_11985 [Actinopolyspora erythraea]|uniref:Transcriptional regulator n=1 Tax=Actinopolyspora erythraea TaxID=414996 RepID=A0A099D5X1_9ACTN|nr:hypothetical protein [Actinopolyspora erythraea]ASU78880.1 hypothetical protein CDG81_11985 [Actinopolyspora erythraea]KGI81232.1 hypothetical protein IL38_12070 [Actinopolyspora erythraea]
MTTTTSTTAQELVDRLRELRDARPVGNAMLDRLREGSLEFEHLRRLVAVEEKAHHAELTAYGALIARFPHRPNVDLYAKLTELVSGAQPKLMECARSLGMDESDVRRWPSELATYAFNGTLSWIALNGSQTAGALALHTDMTVYFSGCADILAGVLDDSGVDVPAEFRTYYEGGHSDTLMRMATETVEDGLRRGDDPEEALFQARLLEESIGQFWRAAADR